MFKLFQNKKATNESFKGLHAEKVCLESLILSLDNITHIKNNECCMPRWPFDLKLSHNFDFFPSMVQ